MQQAHTPLSLAMIAGSLILSACAPGQLTGAGTGQDGAAPPQAIKTIKVAIGQEPSGWDNRITRTTASPTAGGIGNMLPIA
ncbi:MAG: hypothetical protein HY534_02795, partial [Chloroflexi bacterium]|nr:hypothetical protein [Chloroflexota bacterium]